VAAREAHVEAVRRALRRHGEGCVASHESAAVLLDLPVLRVPAVPQLTRAEGSRRTTGKAHVRVAALQQRDVTEAKGLPVTAPARTVVDVARGTSFLAGLITADAALARGLPRRRLSDVVIAQWNWPGIRLASAVVAAADGRAESPAESVVRGRCAQLGLPVPTPQVWYELPSGDQARVDLDWSAHLVVGEVDGRVKYTDPAVLWAEKRRQDELQELRVHQQPVRSENASWSARR
jgi:hypothetical protein